MLGRIHTTIRLTVVSVFILATILTVGLASGLQYYFGQSMARDSASVLYSTTSSSIAGELRSLGRINDNVIGLLANNPVLQTSSAAQDRLEILTGVLERNPLYYGVYLGSGDGRLFEVVNLENGGKTRKLLHAQPSDRWLVIEVEPAAQGESTRQYHYLNDQLETRFSRSEKTSYAVNSRQWYTSAMVSSEAQFTAPYLFAQLGTPGRTVSKRIPGTDTVVAIDITLASASRFLREHKISGHGDVFLYDQDGQLIASSKDPQDANLGIPVPDFALSLEERKFVASLPELLVSNELDWPPIDYAQSGAPSGYSIDLVRLIMQMTGLKHRFVNGHSWPELLEQYTSGHIDILHSVILTEKNAQLGLPGHSYLELPYALVTTQGHGTVTDLSGLPTGALAIPTGWSVIDSVRARFPDIPITEAKSTLHALQLVLSGEAVAALDNEVVMRYIAENHFLEGLQYHERITFGDKRVPDRLHLLVHPDQARLRALIDRAIAAIGPQQHEHLRARWLTQDVSTSESVSSTVPSKALIEIAADPEKQGKIMETSVGGLPYFVYAAQVSAGENPFYVGILSSHNDVVGPFLEHVKLSLSISVFFLLLLLPLSWFFANPIVRPIKQLAAENEKVKRREYAKVQRVNSHVRELDELSDSMVSMVASIQAHEIAQRELMDAFIELIAQAIDDKSSYTGGHCERVPELALMLAEHASASDLPAFRDFHLDTEDEWREYRIAAWLHDCGKITTPEHIVDKGSKLETIYNRIHEVRTRFEVLWRDAEIEYWQQRNQAPERETDLATQMAQKQSDLQQDFAFIASCNVGGEFLDNDKQARLMELATLTWTRHFSDRIGLSPVEELRLHSAEPILPVSEQLLSDKPEHIIDREQTTDYPPELGIDMDIPKHLYNLGELYNLSISRGTLTTEDRFKINEHMISTVKMLESLPFPEELKNVPRFASTHHETMKGTGYPRKLPGESLSTLERILAVADVFEALTASDRPYKKAKPVSEAMQILYNMVQDNHIDRDCFELFVRDRVYLRYAKEFLPASQLDEVDESKFIAA